MRKKNLTNTLRELKDGIEKVLRKGPLTIPTKNENLKNLCFDYAEKHFSNEKELFEFLNEKEEYTTRAIVEAKNVLFYPIDEKMKGKLLKAGYPEDLIQNTIVNTCLVAKIDKKLYLISESAMGNLKQKAFARFDEIDAKMKANFLNATITQAAEMSGVQDTVLPMVFGGKLASLMSGAYTPILPSAFFQIGFDAIREKIGSFQLIEATCTNVSYKMKVAFTGKKAKELQKLYIEKLENFAKRRGLSLPNFKDNSLEFGVVAGTDEAGNGTAYMRPYVGVGKLAGFEIGTPISIYHKGVYKLEKKLETQVENMFSIYQDVIEKLSLAILVDIKNWRAVLDGACQELRIPDEVANRLIVDFAKTHQGINLVTGYDILITILGSSSVYENVMHPSANAFGQYEARLANALTMDLSKWDYDPFELETELKSQIINDYMRVLSLAMEELKVPKMVSSSIINGFEAKVALEKMMNGGNEPTITSWEIYEAILGAVDVYKNIINTKKINNAEDKLLSFEKTIRKARKLCFVKYDVA